MQTFTLTVLAIYNRNPAAAAKRINHILGLPPRMIRHEREFLGKNGYLEKDRQLNWHITPLGKQALQDFDREKAEKNARFLKSAALAAATALNVSPNELSRFTLMTKGMTNDSYIFTCKDKKYIYRRAGIGSDMLVDRGREYENYRVLEGKGISDVVLYHNPFDGTKIAEFIEDSHSIDRHNPQHIEKALETLRKLHRLDIKSPHSFDFIKTIDYYEKICVEAGAEMFKDYGENKNKIKTLLDKAEMLRPKKCFCHIDFVPGNCLMDKNGNVVLIDWEYSGEQDPIADVAMFCISAAYNRPQSDRLLKKYLQRQPEKDEFFRFYTYIAAAGLMWSLWSIFKTANGEVFEGYTERTHNLAGKYSLLAEELF